MRFSIRPPNSERWEVPFDHPESSVNGPTEIVADFTAPFGITVFDTVNGKSIFDSSIGPLIFEDQYMQINTVIPSDYHLYGMGEKDKNTFSYDLSTRQRMTIWSAGQPVKENANLYGHQVHSICRHIFRHIFRHILRHFLDIFRQIFLDTYF